MPEFTTHNALILGKKTLGENTFVISLFTKEYGRHLGVLKKKTPPEIGTLVQATWKARLPEQLGTFYIEEIKAYAPLFLDDIGRLNVLVNLCAILDKSLPERQIYDFLHEQTLFFLNNLANNHFLKNYIRFETELLSALGFALDMTECAGGGNSLDLAYISPKTGRAVSKEKGLPYHNKLLKLPRFLWQESAPYSNEDLTDGLTLTGHFLSTHLGELPSSRPQLYRDIQRRKDG